MVSVGNDSQFNFCKVLETRTGDERFSKNVKRLETATCWYRFGRVARRGRAYWSNAMENVGVAAAINDVAQALADPQVRHRGCKKCPIRCRNHALIANPIHFSDATIRYEAPPTPDSITGKFCKACWLERPGHRQPCRPENHLESDTTVLHRSNHMHNFIGT